MQQTLVGCAKSIAGIALIGLGIFVIYENLRQAATQLIHLLGVIPGEAPRGTSHRHPGGLSSFAGIRRRSLSISAGLRSAHVGIILAAATRHRRNLIVVGLLR